MDRLTLCFPDGLGQGLRVFGALDITLSSIGLCIFLTFYFLPIHNPNPKCLRYDSLFSIGIFLTFGALLGYLLLGIHYRYISLKLSPNQCICNLVGQIVAVVIHVVSLVLISSPGPETCSLDEYRGISTDKGGRLFQGANLLLSILALCIYKLFQLFVLSKTWKDLRVLKNDMTVIHPLVGFTSDDTVNRYDPHFGISSHSILDANKSFLTTSSTSTLAKHSKSDKEQHSRKNNEHGHNKEHGHKDNDHKEHGHKEHDHKEHDHKEHDHKEHDHKEHDHKEHDHKEHDHKEHDHKEHEHKEHDHKEHEHKEHDHKEHGHKEHEEQHKGQVVKSQKGHQDGLHHPGSTPPIDPTVSTTPSSHKHHHKP